MRMIGPDETGFDAEASQTIPFDNAEKQFLGGSLADI